MEEDKKYFKGVFIPIHIWKDQSLKSNEKMLISEIIRVHSENKECDISNKYIADFLGISETNASKTLSRIIKKGYVITVNFDGRKRIIKPNVI